MPSRLLRAALCCLAFLALAGPASARPAAPCFQNWLAYGGTASHSRDASCATRFDGTLRRRWTTNMGGVLEMPPSVSGGVAYTAQDNGRVSALRVSDGTVLWRRNFHTMFTDSPGVWQAGGLMFVESRWQGAAQPARGLFALRLRDGSVAWRDETWGGGEATPIVISTPSGTRVVAVNSAGWMASWAAGTGRKVWQRWIGQPGGGTSSVASLTSAVAPVANTDPALSCPGLPSAGGGGSTNPLPVVYRDKYTGSPAYSSGTIYAANYGGDVYAITWRGVVRWHRQIVQSSAYASPALVDGKLYITSRLGWTYSLNAATGQTRWITRTGRMTYGSPAVGGGSLYTTSIDGTFWRLSTASGRVTWRRRAASRLISSPTIVGHRVFFGVHGKCSNQHGSIVGFQTGSMKRAFMFNDGRYAPAVPSRDGLLIVGFGHLYGFGRAG